MQVGMSERGQAHCLDRGQSVSFDRVKLDQNMYGAYGQPSLSGLVSQSPGLIEMRRSHLYYRPVVA